MANRMISKTVFSFLTMFMLGFTSQSTMAAQALDKFFKGLGAQANASGSGAYKDQAAGYYTGGGYVMRQGAVGVNPINISLPKIGAGCNALDMYFGSFSYITKQELTQLLRKIATGVPTYAFQLALKTSAPQLENTMTSIRKTIQDMNALGLEDCQATQQIVGGMLPKNTAASEIICKDLQKSANNQDWFGARKHCEKPDKIVAEVDKAQAKHKDLMLGEYNLVWHVIKKMENYSNNEELASFVMSVTGTLISKKEGDRFRLHTIQPKADQKDFIAAYVKGGTTSRLFCDEKDKCLAPSLKPIEIVDSHKAANPSMKSQVENKIFSMRTKYMGKGAFNATEMAFLNDAVNLPVYRYIQVSVAAGTPYNMQDTAEFIAISMILYQFERIMTEILEAIDLLQKIQLEDSSIESFKQNLQTARGQVQNLLVGVTNGSLTNLNATIQAQEHAIIARES